jgi:hypothetical protein
VISVPKCGFEGPFQEGKHPYMVRGDLVLTIPNPHRRDISVDLLGRILHQAGFSRDEWLAEDWTNKGKSG